jgi:hypothetical protein
VIPSYLAPPSGGGGFVVTLIDTSAGITDSIEVIQDHPDGQSRLFKASCPPDPIGFFDVTTLAIPGDPRGRVIRFSEFLVARDQRLTGEVIVIKLARLRDMVSPDSPAELYVDPLVLAALRESIDRVTEFIYSDNEPAAIEELQDLKAFVRVESGTTIPNSDSEPGGNIAGGLVAQSATLIFSLSLFT